MDFTLTREQEQFRQEIADFCRVELTGKTRTPDFAAEFVKKIAEKGWLGIDIPQTYGGLGKDALYRVIFNEEMAYHQAPISFALYGRSSLLFGKICLKHGNEQLKRKWLPLLAHGQVIIGQAYTETEAGTDLTRIQTFAKLEGDHFLVNGQKMFISTAHAIPYELLLAKTDRNVRPEYGMSMFLLPNDSPGLTHSPLLGLGGYRTNQVYLDNVKIPVEYLVGELNHGYQYYLENKPLYLNKELGATVGALRHSLDLLIEYCKKTPRNGQRLSKSGTIRQRLTRFAASINALRYMSYRLAWMETQGLDLAYMSTIVRIYTVETLLAFNDMCVQVLGQVGLLMPQTEGAPFGGAMAWRYQYDGIEYFTRGSPSYTKTLLATHSLGMPTAKEE